jgi:hypothetical protein
VKERVELYMRDMMLLVVYMARDIRPVRMYIRPVVLRVTCSGGAPGLSITCLV